MATGSNLGMMDAAFFCSKTAILEWLNSTFSFHISKIEETASGAVACQIIDSIFPGDVAMSKVRWDAKSSHEFVGNYKIIQQVFEKKGVDRYIDVEKLIRAKFQDNLEFMQWLKAFWERNVNPSLPYDALARRAKGRGADSMPAFTTSGAAAGGSDGEGPAVSSRSAGAAPAAATAKLPPKEGVVGQQAAPSAKASGMAQAKHAGSKAASAAGSAPIAAASWVGTTGTPTQQMAALRKHVAEQEASINELRETCAGLEKERDFYFSKLRDIEILLQSYDGPDKQTADKVLAIMYATDGAEGDFASPGANQESGGAGVGPSGTH